jgi:hypothetical protein
MVLMSFLSGETPDFAGRYLADIWEFDDDQVEATHDFIQLVFPLLEPSRSSFHGVHLSQEEVDVIKKLPHITRNLKNSAHWFLGFLKRNPAWKGRFNHNQLRITRAIRSLRVLVSDHEADKFRSEIMELVGANDLINEEALEYWRNA